MKLRSMNHKINSNFSKQVGFAVNSQHINKAIVKTNTRIANLPDTLFKSIDYKTTSAMIGALFCDHLASLTGSVVNPIEKGYPDIIPASAANATEKQLRKYPQGLEIKCTIGNITQGVNLRAGQSRIKELKSITWQAHHREVKELLGLTWDFVDNTNTFNYPAITGAFYADNLIQDDWGKISGITGRNTKVTGIQVSGRHKMGDGWVSLIDDPDYLKKFKRILNVNINPAGLNLDAENFNK